MRFFARILTVLWCLFFVSLLGVPAANAADEGRDASSFAQSYGDLALSFEANQGQSDRQVRFLSRGNGYSFFLTQTGAVLTFSRDSHSDAVLRMQLAGANPSTRIQGVNELPGKSNYFLGNDSSRWRTGVPTYSRVKYENVYPGISLVYYGNQRQLEYDFVVAPGADPRQIRLTVAGARKLKVDAEGNLLLQSAGSDVRLLAPKVYQQISGQKREIAGQWKLEANVAGFRLGAYDRTQPLVIDPVLMYSSFLGGSQTNALSRIAIDAAGNAYVAGYTASGNFPAAPTPQAMTFGGGAPSRGAFVAKIDPSGSNLLYSTYLSGSTDEEATGLAVDSSGNIYVAGNTHSTDFPTTNAFQSTCATHTQAGTCASAFLTKISPTGDALVFSTYIGGSGGESARSLAIDSTGSAYVLGVTSSLDFPVTAAAAQAKCGGACQQNAFVAKFTPSGDSLAYASFLGGSGVDDAADIAVDASGNAYVTGHTTSADFPMVTPYQKACTANTTSSSPACVATAFVAKINADGSAFAYSTYLGGSKGSQASAIAVDSHGSAYVTGSTQSSDFPVLKAFQKSCGLDPASGQCSIDAFLTKLAPSGKTLLYSTYLGGSGRDEASGIVVDTAGNAHIVGRTESTDFPTARPLQSQLKGTSDAFAARFSANGSSLSFSTYHGGSATESGNGIALDAKGNIYLAGETSSPDFPTNHPFQSSCAGTCANAFVSKMSPPPPATAPTITSAASTTFTVGTAGTFTVTTTGSPTPAIDDGGATLPTGVSFVDNGDGTGTLSGTPASGTGGTYPITFTASNGTLPDATQSFTLTVNETPSVIGPSSLTCTVGSACSAGMSTSGFPTPTMSETGALPTGVTFTDNGDGTGTLGGTPAVGTGGTYNAVTVDASNVAGSAPPHPVPITVNEAPAITSGNKATFTVGAAGTFTVVTRGFPFPTITETGALPTGVTFTDNGNGTATLAGTPTVSGTFTLTIKATNTVSTANQTFTLTVNKAPTITSTNATTFTVGTAGTFTVTTSGSPTPTLSETGALPSGVTFVDNGDGTATLAGTPAVGTGASYSLTLKATNVVGTANQAFTLTVNEPPSVSSSNAATFTAGTAGSFTVTTKGFPLPALTETGALPSGVTFTDNGNGTAKLAGTAAAGTGGTYVLTLHAVNTQGTVTQSFTLTVDEAPSFTSTNSKTCQVGLACPFTVTTNTTAFPTPTLSETVALPTGISFTDNGNGTGTLSGTPAVGTGGVYSLSFKATNTAGTSTQPFTLTIADFTAGLTMVPVTMFQGGSGAGTLTLTAVNGYTGTITPACSAAGVCTFNPTSVTVPNGGNNSQTSTVTVSSTNGTPVGNYTVNVTSTDAAGDFHTVALPYNVECAYALASPTLTPLSGGVANPYPFAVSVTQTNGGSNCPLMATASTPPFTFLNGTVSGGTVTVSGSDTGNGTSFPVNFQLPDNTGESAVINSLQVSFFAVAPAPSTLNFSVVQEATLTPPAVIAGGSTQVTVPMSSSWPAGSQVQYASACGVVGPNGSLDPTNNFGITCSSSTATEVTIQTSPSTVAMQIQHRARPLSPLYMLALAMPAIVFLGTGATGFAFRKRLARSRWLKVLSLLTLALLLTLISSCGGGIKGTIGQPGNSNNFTITVLGTVTDSTGVVEGVEVQTISLPVTPQI